MSKFPRLALLVFSMGVFCLAAELRFQNDEHEISLQQFADRQVLTLNGHISRRFSELKQVLARVEPGKDVVLKLNSDGGYPVMFNEFMNQLRKKLEAALVVAYVPENARCSSACIYLLLKSDLRIGASGAQFGFHAVSDGRGNLFPIETSVAEYRASGMNANFLNAMIDSGVFSRLELTFYSSFEMYVNGELDAIIDAAPDSLNYEALRPSRTRSCNDTLAK